MKHTRHRRPCAYCPRKVDRVELVDGVCFNCRVEQKTIRCHPLDYPEVLKMKSAWKVQDERNKRFGGSGV